jgi:chromosome partitioning protein
MFMRNNLAQQVVAEVQKHFGEVVFQTIIPRTVRLSEAPSHGKTIHEYDANGLGSAAYKSLAREVMQRYFPHLLAPVVTKAVQQPDAEEEVDSEQ